MPAEFRDGIVTIEASPKTVPHPIHADIYTLGECIPLEWSGAGADLQSRVVLYHGSFQALAGLGEFDWRAEAWETLTHELRHHLEWRANVSALEAYDWAAEQNFARHEGEAFDAVFYRSGERLADGVYKVDDDVFLERAWDVRKDWVEVPWHGRRYQAQLAKGLAPPLFVTLDGLAEPPPGEAVLVFPRRPSLFTFWRRVAPTEAFVRVQAIER